MTDNQIIELFFGRSENAIDETDKKYGAYCRKISMNILSSREDCEEAVKRYISQGLEHHTSDKTKPA